MQMITKAVVGGRRSRLVEETCGRGEEWRVKRSTVTIRSQPGDSQDSGDEELAPRTGPCALPRSTLAAGGGGGVGFVGGYPAGNMSLGNGRELMKQPQPTDYNQSVLTMQKSVTITVTPQRSNSMDLLNFEEKRQLIASSLSLSDILHVSPAAAHVAKEVAASTVIGWLGWL
uniref:Uncharacterized protein n=1 Tax=Anopheles christyi TaxID=43041 RepID=A0A182KGS5_9DIPT